MERILTVPSVIEEKAPYFLTGNHYVSLPEIRGDGTIDSIALLSGRLNALMNFKGAVRPRVFADGEELSFSGGGYEHDFIPSFSAGNGKLSCGLSYAAPEEIQGFTCVMRLKAGARVSVSAGFDISVDAVERRVFHSYPLEGKTEYRHYGWTDTLICEMINGGSAGGFGVSCRGAEIKTGEASASIIFSAELEAGTERTVLFHFSTGAETDGIGLVNMDMQRRGQEPVQKLIKTLDSRHRSVSDPVLEKYANFNMNFCLYYSCGYTFDTGEFCMLTSKSPAYYVSSAFWSRDCFLWAFPGILYADAVTAKKVLLTGYSKYIRNIGIHALYTDGRVLYPGFELDELAAPVIALERYIRLTGDSEILKRPEITEGLRQIRENLDTRFDPETGLYSTELDPSDDPVELRHLTYDNALCAAALNFMGEKEAAAALRENIKKRCTAEYEGKTVFSYSTDGSRHIIYDDPPGSLLLLPYYGLCPPDDPVFLNTAEMVFSDKNPNFYANGRLFGTGCDHTPYPWPASLINLLLGRGYCERAAEALKVIAERTPVACESVSLKDGTLNTGDAFATMAGFIAAGIFESIG